MQNLNENYLTSLTISIEEDVKNYKNAIKEEVEKLLKTFKEEYEKTKKDVELNNAIFRMICNLK
jgi:ABC-type enterochelin transport system substrate-binding protein